MIDLDFVTLRTIVDNIKLAADGLHIDLEAINDTQFTPDVDLRESRLYAQTEGVTVVSDWELAATDNVDANGATGASSLNGHRDAARAEASPTHASSPTASFVAMGSDDAEQRHSVESARAALLSPLPR